MSEQEYGGMIGSAECAPCRASGHWSLALWWTLDGTPLCTTHADHDDVRVGECDTCGKQSHRLVATNVSCSSGEDRLDCCPACRHESSS